MKVKSLILIFVALGCGLVATIGISQVMQRKGGSDADIQMEQILVAKGSLDIGAILDANSVVLEEWPAAKVPEGALHSLDEVSGKFPQTRFYKGEPILAPKIGSKGENAAQKIEPGYRTATIKVDEDTVMEGIGPGDRVDVMVYLKKGDNIPETGVYPIIKNVRVFAKGAQTERVVDAKSGQETRARTISLMVKLPQVQEIALASQMGKITLALRNPKDDPAEDKDQVVPLSELLNGKAVNGDDKKHAPSEGPGNLLSELTKAVGGGAKPEAAPALPSFVMTIQSPNEIKSYQWGDHGGLPTESVVLSLGAGSSASSVPEKSATTPPVTGEAGDK
jgi:pilus assembly protein CpaB